MTKKQNNNPQHQANWGILIRLISLTVFAVVVAFSYLLLEDELQEIWNRKKSTPEEIAQREMDRKSNKKATDINKVENGIHLRSGMYDDPNLHIVISACTSCHSSQLITQNKATREGWEQMIRWMQATQSLPDLSKQEPIILDYLATYYAPTKEGRRPNIDIENISWYVLEL